MSLQEIKCLRESRRERLHEMLTAARREIVHDIVMVCDSFH
jgi:hypothetical protein